MAKKRKKFQLKKFLLRELGRILMLTVVAVCALQFYIYWKQEQALRVVKMADRDLKTLVRLTLVRYENSPPPERPDIWKELGPAAPFLDPWGTGYMFEMRGVNVIWKSAGPDHEWDTSDDVVRVIPFGRVENP